MRSSDALTPTALATLIWKLRYRAPGDASMDDTWRRVSGAVAAAEPRDRPAWAERFRLALADTSFLPGGRILAGAGTDRRVTLVNCFVMGTIEDSMEGIFRALDEGARTMQLGGGVGYDFSTLRPRGTLARSTGQIASGPVSFMRLWDAMCATLQTTSERRGAMMGTLRCDHPDIDAFIDAKRSGRELSNFNLSVLVTDAFLAAVRADGEVALRFPVDGEPRVFGWRRARLLWNRMLESALGCGEPGFLFVDRINGANPLWYRERITATNPCGEAPLPPYGACVLGSLNLTRFVQHAFEPEARLDLDGLDAAATLATRFLDDVVDVTRFPLPAQKAEAQATRRIGLGVTGLADALVMMGLRYDDAAGRAAASVAMRTIGLAAHRASVALALERGPFPAFERDKHLAGASIRRLPEPLQASIRENGIRNGGLLAIAPAGTISLLAGNVSSGMEPIFRARCRRRIRRRAKESVEVELVDYAFALAGGALAGTPALLEAWQVPPEAHIDMQAALQPFVDGAISKTVNLPRGHGREDLQRLVERAHDAGLKGLTVFPAVSPIGAVLSPEEAAIAGCEAIQCRRSGHDGLVPLPDDREPRRRRAASHARSGRP